MYKFCTADDVKEYMTARAGYTGYDAKIDSLIPHATREIQTFCNRTFIRDTYIEYINLPDSRRNHKIWLSERNVQTSPAPVIKIAYETQPIWDSVTAVADSVYRIDNEKGVLTLLFATAHCADALKIEYTAGYEVGAGSVVAVPDDVRIACALQTSANLERLLAKEFGQKEKTERKGTLNTKLEDGFIRGLLPQCRNILRDYVKLRTGSRVS